MRALILALLIAGCSPIVHRVAVTRSRDSIDWPMRVVVVTRDALIYTDTMCVLQRWEQGDGTVRIHPCGGIIETVDQARIVGPCECGE